MAVFFTSDTHFGDPRVLRIDRRPFASLAEHDAALVQAWNEVVSHDDDVWHLGDVAGPARATSTGDILGSLHGAKHLVIGNNDGPGTTKAAGWTSLQHYAELEVDGRKLVLCHYPFRTWNGMGKGVVDLHGHSHGKLSPMPRQYDVGVDAQGFRPVTLAEILSSRRGRSRALETRGDRV